MTSSLMRNDCAKFDSSDNDGISEQSTFYSPLCVSGYLTPLQRKKLREKRKLGETDYKDCELDNFKKVKKPRIVHTKRAHSSNIRMKNRGKIPGKLTKEGSSNVQYLVAKVVSKVAGNSVKNKKFFKTDSCSRLEKATFTFSLVSEKNYTISDRNNKETAEKQNKRNFYAEKDNEHKHFYNAVNKPGITTTPLLVKIANVESKYLNSESVCSNNCSVLINLMSHEAESENSLQTVIPAIEDNIFDFNWPSDSVLLERQQRARNIVRTQHILREANKKTDEQKELIGSNNRVKLFPVFNFAAKKNLKENQEVKKNPKNVTKCVKNSGGGEQMIIDAGQKEIGAKICNTCNMIYTIGQEEDEKLHSNYHNAYLNLKFSGWKDENVVAEYCDGRVIMVKKDEKGFKLKKIQDVLEIANRDLGFPNGGIPVKPELTFLLYVSTEKRVIGCIVAEPISSANKLLLADKAVPSNGIKSSDKKVYRIGNWYSSFEKVPAVCGVNRIWVDRSFRRQKVASRMLDCLRCNFIYGHVIGLRELAFTDPSPDGREFAASYTGTDNFLVYR